MHAEELSKVRLFVDKILTQSPFEQRRSEGVTQEHRDLEFLLNLFCTIGPESRPMAKQLFENQSDVRLE